MKKIISIFICFNFIFSNICLIEVYANNIDVLSKIENELYGFDYNKETSQQRVSRLEKSVYGKVLSGDITKRVNKLAKDISADVIGLEVTPTEDTFKAMDEIAEESNVNYPIVNEIEQKLFNQTYKNRDFHTRIVTIERKLFGKIYDVDDYATRMDRIKSAVMPEVIAKKENSVDTQNYYYDDDSINSADLLGFSNNRFGMPFGQRNYTRPYANYGDEYSDFSQTTGQAANLNDELSQLEYETFGTEFSNEDTETRIKRLNSVNKAKKSSQKYDSNKFSQRMSTAMEIGAMLLMILAMVL